MPFQIPNEASAAFPDQAEPDAVDIDILVAAIKGDYVVSGCAVTAQGSPDMTVAVAVGVVRINGASVAVSAGNVTVGAAHATNPRFDLITVNDSGTKACTAGTAAANPVFPAIPANSVVIAAIYVPANDTDIDANQIVDKRVIGGLPGGSDTQVQFNDSGVFGGDAGLTYNKATNVLSVDAITAGANGLAGTIGTGSPSTPNALVLGGDDIGEVIIQLDKGSGPENIFSFHSSGDLFIFDENGIVLVAVPYDEYTGNEKNINLSGENFVANAAVADAGQQNQASPGFRFVGSHWDGANAVEKRFTLYAQPIDGMGAIWLEGQSGGTWRFDYNGRFRSSGSLATQQHTAPADATLEAGDMDIWFDQTDGAAKLKIKAKQADGTVRTGEVALS